MRFKRRVFCIFFIIILYLYILNPVFLPIANIGLVKLTYIFLLFYTIKEYRKVLLLFKPVLMLFAVLLIYSFIIALIGDDISNIYNQLVVYIELVLLPIVLSLFMIKSGIKLSKQLLLLSILASLISLFAFLDSDLLQFLRTVQPDKNFTDDILATRSFGFSSELEHAYSWSLGLIIVYYLNYLNMYRWYLLFIPIIIFSILINARSGFIVFIVGLIVYLFFNINRKNIFRIITCFFIVSFIVKFSDFTWINDNTYNFIADFFIQLQNIFDGRIDDTYVSIYTGRMFILPDNSFQWIFGRGKRLIWGISGVGNSDVGYLNDLALGGIIYMVILYATFIKVLSYIKPVWFYCALLFIVFILNIKGPFFETNACTRAIMLIVFYGYLYDLYVNNRKKVFSNKENNSY